MILTKFAVKKLYIYYMINNSTICFSGRSTNVCNIINGQVDGIEVTGSSASVSALDFSSTSILAVGNECGLVRLFCQVFF